MGMIIEGRWADGNHVITNGAFRRPSSVYGDAIAPGIVEALRNAPSRFHLIVSLSCSWSQRATIMRHLKGLVKEVPTHFAHGPRIQGYAINGGAPWRVPGTDREILHLHELYTLGNPTYTGRSTVPILWDSEARRIVSNESSAIMRAFNAVPPKSGRPDFTFFPDHLAPRIDALNLEIYEGLANGVYRAGFAERQEAYDTAVRQVFATLDSLEAQLSERRYLLGPAITEADWRLFPTLVRFDAIYYVLHKCCRRRLIDYSNLWAYARDLYTWRGVAETVDFAAMRQASYANDTGSNANRIVAVAPDIEWHQPHGREAFGPAQIALRAGGTAVIDPTTLRVSAGD